MDEARLCRTTPAGQAELRARVEGSIQKAELTLAEVRLSIAERITMEYLIIV